MFYAVKEASQRFHANADKTSKTFCKYRFSWSKVSLRRFEFRRKASEKICPKCVVCLKLEELILIMEYWKHVIQK